LGAKKRKSKKRCQTGKGGEWGETGGRKVTQATLNQKRQIGVIAQPAENLTGREKGKNPRKCGGITYKQGGNKRGKGRRLKLKTQCCKEKTKELHDKNPEKEKLGKKSW